MSILTVTTQYMWHGLLYLQKKVVESDKRKSIYKYKKNKLLIFSLCCLYWFLGNLLFWNALLHMVNLNGIRFICFSRIPEWWTYLDVIVYFFIHKWNYV